MNDFWKMMQNANNFCVIHILFFISIIIRDDYTLQKLLYGMIKEKKVGWDFCEKLFLTKI